MNLALGKQQIAVLVALIIFTLLVITTFAFSAVEHINVWHFLSSIMPKGFYGGHFLSSIMPKGFYGGH